MCIRDRCEMLPLSPATIQRAIVIALGGLRDPIALDPLLVLLPKTRDTLRCQIVTALSQLEQPSAITAMVKAFRAHVRNSDEHEAHNFCQMCASMQSALISMGPVSYTHLDVYKRQVRASWSRSVVRSCACPACPRFLRRRGWTLMRTG